MRHLSLEAMIVRVAVGAAVFVLALEGGTYDLIARQSLGVAVWWAIGLVVLFRLGPAARPSTETMCAAALLAAFALWTALSIAWAPSAEAAFAQFDRVALYLGVFFLTALVCAPRNAPAWSDGIAAGLAATAAVALASRFFPGHFSTHPLASALPGAEARLSYPVNYWNGLGILLGLGFPLLLRAASSASTLLGRAAAVAPLPAVAAAIY